LRAALHQYVPWYNTERISMKLHGLSPIQYRAQAPRYLFRSPSPVAG
jgi:transposase InsO family protein